MTLENRKKVNVEAFAVCQTIEKKSDQAISPSPRSYKSRGSSFLTACKLNNPDNPDPDEIKNGLSDCYQDGH